MHTLLTSPDYAYNASVLDTGRLSNQLVESLVILRSLARQYPVNERTGKSGWEGHTVIEMWRGHELQLARYSAACAKELYKNRELAKQDKARSLISRRRVYRFWIDAVTFLEDLSAPDDPPPLIGDEEFHSAFRALLKYRECQVLTFKKWKRGEYPDHATTRRLLPTKRSWRRENYEAIWSFFGRPEPQWYNQWGWTEEPDDMRVFYKEDRIPQMLKELKRKIDKPFPSYLVKIKLDDQ